MLKRIALALLALTIAVGCGRGTYDPKIDSAIQRAKNPQAPAEGGGAEGEQAPVEAGGEAQPAADPPVDPAADPAANPAAGDQN